MAGTYIRMEAHRAAIAARCAKIKRKYPIGFDVRSRLYTIWKDMHFRCYQTVHKAYDRYHGNGIEVCAAWHDYATFMRWALAHGYAENLTIERCDNDRSYEPDNCRWATMSEQQRDRRDNVWIIAFGDTKLQKDWSRDPRCVVSEGSVARRLKTGRDPEWAISAPPRSDIHRKPMTLATKNKIAALARQRSHARDAMGRFS